MSRKFYSDLSAKYFLAHLQKPSLLLNIAAWGAAPGNSGVPFVKFQTKHGEGMLKVDIQPEIASKLRELIEEEDNEDAVIRIRETKVGGG